MSAVSTRNRSIRTAMKAGVLPVSSLIQVCRTMAYGVSYWCPEGKGNIVPTFPILRPVSDLGFLISWCFMVPEANAGRGKKWCLGLTHKRQKCRLPAREAKVGCAIEELPDGTQQEQLGIYAIKQQ